MQVDNMGYDVTVSPKKFLGTPCQGSSTTQHHIAIPIEELNASLEATRDKSHVTDANVKNVQKLEEQGEQIEYIGQCRYCHEEDIVSKLEAPCYCDGSLKYVHRSCIDNWYDTKESIICELCKQPFYPYYAIPEPPPDDLITEISEEWTIRGTTTRIPSPLAVADSATNHLIDSMNKDFSLRNPTGGVIFGTALLIFVAVLIIKDAYTYAPPREDKFSHTLFCGLVIISVPIYILSWFLQCQAYREENRERERDRTA